MQLLGGDAHFSAHPHGLSISKPGGGIDIDRRRIHLIEEGHRMSIIFSDDGLGMSRTVFCNVFHGFFQTSNGLQGKCKIQVFGGIILLRGFQKGRDQSPCLRICHDLHSMFYGELFQFRQKALKYSLMDEKRLHGIADSGSLGFRIFNDG